MPQVGNTIKSSLRSPKSRLFKAISKIEKAFERNKVRMPQVERKYVFLCGGTDEKGALSQRRSQLKKFAETNLQNCVFFLAEDVFKVYEKEINVENLLDMENRISSFSDFIIIVLESISAFCELGAFATDLDIRKKLIIINDSAHETSRSFINLGPIKAIKEVCDSDEKLLYYKMEGQLQTDRVDGIADTYSDLYKILVSNSARGVRRKIVLKMDPKMQVDKYNMMFIHDLIQLMGPVSRSELIIFLTALFPDTSFNELTPLLGLLMASGDVELSQELFYSSNRNSLYFEYDNLDLMDIRSSFRVFFMKTDKSRYKNGN